MPPPVPKFLFRAFGDKTNGSNDENHFAPQAPPSILSEALHGLRYSKAHGPLKKQLHRAIIGHDTTANPFIFWTSSFLLVLLHAIKKQRAGQNGVQIACIEVNEVKNPADDRVTFHWLPTTMQKLGMQPLSARFTNLILNYDDVWVTSDTIMLGSHSMRANLETLVQAGLYRLIPELGVISMRPNPGLATPSADLRKLWYKHDRDCTSAHFALAAKLAMLFECKGFDGPNFSSLCPTVPVHILAWLLALKGQDPDGNEYRKWLETYSVHQAVNFEESIVDDDDSTLEYDQWARLYVGLQDKRIPYSPLTEGVCSMQVVSLLKDPDQQHEVEEYRRLKKRQREDEEEEEDEPKRAKVSSCTGG